MEKKDNNTSHPMKRRSQSKAAGRPSNTTKIIKKTKQKKTKPVAPKPPSPSPAETSGLIEDSIPSPPEVDMSQPGTSYQKLLNEIRENNEKMMENYRLLEQIPETRPPTFRLRSIDSAGGSDSDQASRLELNFADDNPAQSSIRTYQRSQRPRNYSYNQMFHSEDDEPNFDHFRFPDFNIPSPVFPNMRPQPFGLNMVPFSGFRITETVMSYSSVSYTRPLVQWNNHLDVHQGSANTSQLACPPCPCSHGDAGNMPYMPPRSDHTRPSGGSGTNYLRLPEL